MKAYKNTVAALLYWTGIIYVGLTFIGGIALGDLFEVVEIGYYSDKTHFNWTYMFVAWITGFMFSLLFFGAAEIIELLQQQRDETAKVVQVLGASDAGGVREVRPASHAPTFDDLPEL